MFNIPELRTVQRIWKIHERTLLGLDVDVSSRKARNYGRKLTGSRRTGSDWVGSGLGWFGPGLVAWPSVGSLGRGLLVPGPGLVMMGSELRLHAHRRWGTRVSWAGTPVARRTLGFFMDPAWVASAAHGWLRVSPAWSADGI
ncbi:transposon protein [Striga asiatica]|uniref:Transposon protein n=1 Tax=Striga asiatica TaxID=4170 RepID=A0A5A7NY62_STRAF|nr:transposon protein [Striga asiatica]